MTTVSLKQVQEFVRRGMVAQSAVDDIIASQQETRRKELDRDQAAIVEKRFELAEPVEFTVPMELLTENKLRAMKNVFQRGAHVKRQRMIVCQAWNLALHGETPAVPVIVTFTRYGRHMDSHDSLAAAFKHVTDEVTRLLGLRNDDTKEVSWNYRQKEPGKRPPKIGIRIEAMSKPNGSIE